MKSHIKRVVAISFLCLAFTAITNANIGIISQFASQNNNSWIGPLSIALIFLGSGVGSLYNRYIHKYRFKAVIFVGALGWDIFIAFSVLFLYIGFQNYVIGIIVVGSLVSGLIMSLYYNGIFNYVNECGKLDGCVEKYFGLNLCFNQSSNIVGNTLSWFLIEPLGQKVYSLVMMAIGIALSSGFLLLKQFTASSQLAKAIASQDLDQAAIEEQLNKSEIQSSTDFQGGKKMKQPWSIVFCYVMSGVMISFVFGQFSILFYRYYQDLTKEQLNRLTFTAFMIEGVGQFFGGLIIAVCSRRIKNLSILFCLNSLLFLASVGLVVYGFEEDNIDVIYGAAFLIGVADCLCFSLSLSLAGRWDEAGISIFNLGQSGAVAVLSLLHIFLELQFLAIIYLCVFAGSCLSLCASHKQLAQQPTHKQLAQQPTH